ncbi:DUF2017 domain-containing protein [Brevibacterium sp. 50QC2O2]|jgi:hypothetical protein|uniref:DUF2017 domain-containing protein n=1 Tax=Brevibacterium sp. 50QC2O2 TaxID=2968459 RepID=UPI00211C5C5F|nr:DUF2017 domain-containing protein [Brevibacterium sp. 50QC2O2]MCQ9387324.1 DUF2017 domain-containing protein [Brevibacterium sp. 50QC2O2]
MRISGSHRHPVVIDLEANERRLLTGLFTDTIELLGGAPAGAANAEIGDTTDMTGEATEGLGAMFERMFTMGPQTPPEDPALARLLPSLDREDPERSAEFRRYTEPELRESKLSNLRRALLDLDRSGRIDLDREGARAWMIAVGDVRLVLAARLGLQTEADVQAMDTGFEELSEADQMHISVYDFLSWMQERIVDELMDLDGLN